MSWIEEKKKTLSRFPLACSVTDTEFDTVCCSGLKGPVNVHISCVCIAESNSDSRVVSVTALSYKLAEGC